MAAELESRVEELQAARRRLREATLRFGKTLAATHDPEELRRVIVESAVEATGATGGELLGGREAAAVGDPSAWGERLELPLLADQESLGTLVLTGAAFDAEAREVAVMLAGQAVVALENARLHASVERQALLDELTGLSNRRRSEEVLLLEFSRADRLGAPLALVFADLDGFKGINERHWHPVGDLVLREFASTVRENIREIDQPARWGGEEFALLLPGTDVAGALKVAERLRAALERRLIRTPEGVTFPVTASFGVAAYPDERTSDELVAAADAALYEAKRIGKNQVVAAGEPEVEEEGELG